LRFFELTGPSAASFYTLPLSILAQKFVVEN